MKKNSIKYLLILVLCHTLSFAQNTQKHIPNSNKVVLNTEESNEGFILLFNGINLEGWQGDFSHFYVENGEIVVEPKMVGHKNLFTEKEYSDFVFRFEFKLTPDANNGLAIRSPLVGNPAYDGIELQILDNSAPGNANLDSYRYHGSVYAAIAAKRGFLKQVGEWNIQEVEAIGTKIKITLNDEVILDGDITHFREHDALDGRDHPGFKRDKGYIGFLGHGSQVFFRNIRVKDLSN